VRSVKPLFFPDGGRPETTFDITLREAFVPEDFTEPGPDSATAGKDLVVWKGLHDGKPTIAVLEEDGAVHIHPLILVPDYLWNTPHWDMPIPDWASNLPPRDALAAAAVDLDGRRREAIAELETILRRLRQARTAIKSGADLAKVIDLIDIAGLRSRLVVAHLDRR
jgi:hypothetical protein